MVITSTSHFPKKWSFLEANDPPVPVFHHPRDTNLSDSHASCAFPMPSFSAPESKVVPGEQEMSQGRKGMIGGKHGPTQIFSNWIFHDLSMIFDIFAWRKNLFLGEDCKVCAFQ